jgi:hypothetical protein
VRDRLADNIWSRSYVQHQNYRHARIYGCIQRVSATIRSTISLKSSRNGLSSNLASDKSRMYPSSVLLHHGPYICSAATASAVWKNALARLFTWLNVNDTLELVDPTLLLAKPLNCISLYVQSYDYEKPTICMEPMNQEYRTCKQSSTIPTTSHLGSRTRFHVITCQDIAGYLVR